MIGETLALVMGDTKIWSAGTFWERNKFTNRTFFAPFAYKEQLNTRKFKVEDLARLNETRKLELSMKCMYLYFLSSSSSTSFSCPFYHHQSVVSEICIHLLVCISFCPFPFMMYLFLKLIYCTPYIVRLLWHNNIELYSGPF